MKSVYTYLVASASALLLASCADDTFNQGLPNGSCTITAELGGDEDTQSRTCVDVATYDNPKFVGLLWTAGDSIGVYSNETKNALFRNTSQFASRKTDFNGDLSGAPLYAYYPFLKENAGRDAGDLIGEVRSTQPFAMNSGLLYDDFKVGRPEEGSTTSFKFTHLFSLLKISLDATGTAAEGERLDYVKVSVTAPDGSPRGIAGKFHFDATSATPSYSNVTETTNDITMKWTDAPTLESGNTYVGFITAIPDIHTGDKLTMTVATESRLLSFTVDCAKDFQSGNVYNFPMTLDLYEGKAEYGWKESARATITDFRFTVAANQGKILDKKVVCSGTNYSVNSVTQENAAIEGSNITCTIPYLYNFRLTPTFSVSEGATVTVNGETVVSGKTEVDFSKPVTLTVTTEADSHDYTVSVANSGLPVVVLRQSKSGDFSEVNDGNFFIKKIRNKFLDFMIRGKETSWVEDDKITVYNADGTVALAESNCGLRQRGNTTKKYPKKALAIKLVKKSAILDMPSSKRFVLLANWLDHSMIRNTMAFTLAGLIKRGVAAEGLEPGIPWNPSGRNVELVIDGRHVGNYLLGEQIKIEKNRLNINDSYEDRKKDGLSTALADCGYLFEFDQNYDEIWKFGSTGGSNLPIMIKDDEIGNDATLWSAVQAKINGIDKNLVSGNFTEAYKDFDIYSAIDQLIIYELAQNREYTEPRSVYYCMNGNGKLTAGPVWDFDRGTFHNPTRASSMGNESNRIKPYNKWLFEFSTGTGSNDTFNKKTTTPGVWYRQLIKDPTFKAALKARWTKLLPYLQMLPGEIERVAYENYVSWTYNNAMWPTTTSARKAGNDNNTFKDWSGDEDLDTYEEVIDNMINCYNSRLEGLNTLINSL